MTDPAFEVKPQSHLRAILATATILAIVATSAYLYFSNLKPAGKETPPSISLTTAKFKGQLILGDTVCKIPSLTSAYDANDVADFVAPTGSHNTLSAGIHLYHADSDITVQDILNNIQPTVGNRTMVAYYPSSNNPNKVFQTYPALGGQGSIANPGTYVIPANEGFILFSCQDSQIWNVKTEAQSGNALPAILNSKTEGWVLISATTGSINTSLSSYKNKITSLWAQHAQGFDFPAETTNIDDAQLTSGFNMVWLKFGNAQENPEDAPADFHSTINDDLTVKLSWNPPQNPKSPIIGYNLKILYEYSPITKFLEQSIPLNVKAYNTTLLVKNTKYIFTVEAVYQDNTHGAAAEIKLTTPGTTPVPVHVFDRPKHFYSTPNDEHSLMTSWSEPEGYLENQLQGYYLAYGTGDFPGAANSAIKGSQVIVSNIKQHVFDGLETGKEYWFTVEAIDTQGTMGPSAFTKGIPKVNNTDASSPLNFNDHINDDLTVTLTWNKPHELSEETLKGYYLVMGSSHGYSAETIISQIPLPPEIKGYNTVPLSPDSEYWFTVAAENSNYLNGSTASLTLKTPSTTPNALHTVGQVKNLTATLKADTTMIVNWEPQAGYNSDQLQNYYFDYTPSPKRFQLISPSTTTFTTPTLTPSTEYSFTVFALDKNKIIGPSVNIKKSTTKATITKPINLTAKVVKGMRVVTVNWQKPDSPDLNYLKAYKIQYYKGAVAPANLVLTTDALPNVNTDFVKTLELNTDYSVTVQAIDKADQAGPTEVATFNLGPNLAAPQNFKVTIGEDLKTNLTWDLPTGFETGDIKGYKIKYGTGGLPGTPTSVEKFSQDLGSKGENSYPYINTLEAKTDYWFSISANYYSLDGTDNFGPAATATATTKGVVTQLEAPENFGYKLNADNTVTFTWAEPAGLTSASFGNYHLYLWKDGAWVDELKVVDPTLLSTQKEYTTAVLVPGDYFATVAAVASSKKEGTAATAVNFAVPKT